MTKLTAHRREVAPSHGVAMAGIARRHVTGDVDRADAAIVVRGVKNSARFVDPEFVGAGAADVKERYLARRCQIANVHDMDVTAGRRTDSTGALLPNKCESFLAGRAVVPPDIVRLTTDSSEAAQLDRIRRDSSSAASANVPDFD